MVGVAPPLSHRSRVETAATRLRRRWLVAVTLGELAGFTIPSLVGAIAWTLDARSGLLYALLVLAGAGEGAVLGTAQWLVLRDPLPDLSPGRWIGATGGAAALAWSLGMLPSTLGERLEAVPTAVLIPAVALGGTALLLSIGAAQALVLHAHVARTRRWVAANVLAWCAGLVVSVSVLSILVSEDTTLPGALVAGVIAGVLMGATVAFVTGWFLVRMLEPR